MKLLILGAGVVGKHIARTAAGMPAFRSVTVADRLHDRAAAVAAGIGGTAITIDAADQSSLVATMEQADIVVSAIGPATRFGVSTLRAAITARRTFIDITDDPAPTLEMLTLDAEAKAAGVTAVIGTGASPGIANMLAVAAGSRLDRVDRILTGWGSSDADEADDELGDGGNAALQHWVEQCSGMIPALVDGHITNVMPLQPVVVDFPGIGLVTGRNVGHPEPVTLSRRFTELRHASNVMNFPDFVYEGLEAAANAVNAGASHAEGARVLAAHLDTGSGILAALSGLARFALHRLDEAITPKLWLPPIWALAEGEKNGRPVRIGARLTGFVPGGTGPMTAVPSTVIAAMLASGQARPGAGVHSVDTAIDPDVFFGALAPFLRDAQGRLIDGPIELTSAEIPASTPIAAA